MMMIVIILAGIGLLIWAIRAKKYSQALFALVDSFAKVFVTCVPEPRGRGHADSTRRGSKPPRPAAHECGTSDA